MKLSTLEMKENNIYDVNDTVCVKDVERVSMLETENAKIESELEKLSFSKVKKSDNNITRQKIIPSKK